MQAARAGGFAYAIIRPGRLVGEPHSNSGMVRKDPHPGRLDVRVEKDDCLNGDLSRQAVARLAVSAATWDCRVDLQMSVVHCDGLVEPSERKWHRLMAIGEVEKGKRLD